MNNMKKYKITFNAGWYKDNPLNILKVSFGEVIPDHPVTEWITIVLIQIVIGKFEVALCVDKN